MKGKGKIVKDDINFLEYPNWVIGKKNKDVKWKIEKSNGTYEIFSPLGLPRHFDKIVFYFLLHKLYKEEKLDSCVLKTSRYEIAKNVFHGARLGGRDYARIMTAVSKWQAVYIKFDGVFYDGDGYTTRGFSIVDEYVLRHETGELTIRFNESYIKQLKETTFYKLVDFDQYKKLHKASAASLYEVLVKSFKGRSKWEIGLQLLAEKLTFEKKTGAKKYYPSDILRYLKPALNEINKKTDLYINLKYNRETGVCIFKKLKKGKNQFIPATKSKAEIEKLQATTDKELSACRAYFDTLSKEDQSEILKGIQRKDFIKSIPDKNMQLLSYMKQVKGWSASDKPKETK